MSETYTPRILREYVRITFTPAGASRKRTVWAQKLRVRGDLVTYLQVTPDGDSTFDGGKLKGVPIEQTRMILATTSGVVEKRAVMSLHYGELVAEGTPEWDYEMAAYGDVHAKHAEARKARSGK